MKTEMKKIKNDKININYKIEVKIIDEEDRRKKSKMLVEYNIYHGEINYNIRRMNINQKYGFDFEHSGVLTDFKTATYDCFRVIKGTVDRYSYKDEKEISDMVYRRLREFVEKEKYNLFSYNGDIEISIISCSAVLYDDIHFDYIY